MTHSHTYSAVMPHMAEEMNLWMRCSIISPFDGHIFMRCLRRGWNNGSRGSEATGTLLNCDGSAVAVKKCPSSFGRIDERLRPPRLIPGLYINDRRLWHEFAPFINEDEVSINKHIITIYWYYLLLFEGGYNIDITHHIYIRRNAHNACHRNLINIILYLLIYLAYLSRSLPLSLTLTHTIHNMCVDGGIRIGKSINVFAQIFLWRNWNLYIFRWINFYDAIP